MKHTIVFKVRTPVQTTFSWPMEVDGLELLVRTEKNMLIGLGVAYRNIPIEQAPKFVPRADKKDGINGDINFEIERRARAEKVIRLIQAAIAAHIVIDIDYYNVSEHFYPETHESQSDIMIPQMSVEPGSSIKDVLVPFQSIAMAYLGITYIEDDIEVIQFYINGNVGLYERRWVASYNEFYLFLESKHGLKYNNKDAAKQLSLEKSFVDAIDVCLNLRRPADLGEEIFETRLGEFNRDGAYEFILKIVELRGKLRHHSLKSPIRWNPIEQASYKSYAIFMAYICKYIMNLEYGNLINSHDNKLKFSLQAETKGFIVEIIVVISHESAGLFLENANLVKIPRSEIDAHVALSVFREAMRIFDEKFSGHKLLGLRAFLRETSFELFRYDLGPTVKR